MPGSQGKRDRKRVSTVSIDATACTIAKGVLEAPTSNVAYNCSNLDTRLPTPLRATS